ncbi:hypothetical protein FOZ62_013392, partial [Perkinsus olseni]
MSPSSFSLSQTRRAAEMFRASRKCPSWALANDMIQSDETVIGSRNFQHEAALHGSRRRQVRSIDVYYVDDRPANTFVPLIDEFAAGVIPEWNKLPELTMERLLAPEEESRKRAELDPDALS